MTLTRPLSFTVIVLNWNGRPYLEACLSALVEQTYAPERVLLIDNASTDNSVSFVRARFPQVEVWENGGNVGFAAGNNTALRGLASDVALLLNPDVILSIDCLAALAATLAVDPAIGIAGCKLWYPDGQTIQHAGGIITHPQAMPRHFGVGEHDTGQFNSVRDVDYVIGAAMAARREMLDQIGLFDEAFFLYFEDSDLCARARRAGYRVVYEPAATAVHVESVVAVRGSFAYYQRFHTGRWRYLLKHFTPAALLDETLPAEAHWLECIAPDERRAASLAYLATLQALPETWQTRAEANATTPDERAAIERGLRELLDRSRQPVSGEGLARLSAAAQVVEQPFTSNVPVLGPFIAWFRTAWNDIASRWYLHHIVVQQNEFNRLAVSQLETYELELQEQLALLEEQVVEQETLRRRLAALNVEIAELRRALEKGQNAGR